jgi:hypothetical protein
MWKNKPESIKYSLEIRENFRIFVGGYLSTNTKKTECAKEGYWLWAYRFPDSPHGASWITLWPE